MGPYTHQRTYDRWAEMKRKDLSSNDAKVLSFQRNPNLEAFQYPQAEGLAHERQQHASSTGTLPLFMLSHFNCPANDQRCKATVVFCASLWHYVLYRAYQVVQERGILHTSQDLTKVFQHLPAFAALSWYAVALFAFALFSIITMDCTLFICKYVFYDSAVYLKQLVTRATSGAGLVTPLGMVTLRKPAIANLTGVAGPKYTSGGSTVSPHFLLESMSKAGTLNRTPYEFAHRYRQAAVSG